MKKKTSLWISGITTVALLVTAVGSFAAWKITDSTETFSVTAGDSVAVKTSVVKTPSDKLVPIDPASGEATSLVGSFKAELVAGATANDLKGEVTKLQVNGSSGDAIDSTFISGIYTDENCTTPITNGILTGGTDNTYYVQVRFADDGSTWNADKVAKYAGKNIDLEVKCSAVAKTQNP